MTGVNKMAEVDERNLMVIDTDCGIDDALAIMLAISFKKTWKILAITCCHGNTTVEKASGNVLRVLHLCGELQIPVYKGCERPLLAEPCVSSVHGDDGLGNVAYQYSTGNLTLAEGHAVNVLIQLARQYKGQINLVALAPLTNLAMAHRLDPDFTSNLKSLTFMGGNIHGVGNVTPAAEFNFHCDPEAAHMIVTQSRCYTTMVPWETTLKHGVDWETFTKWINQGTVKANFIKKSTSELAELCRKDGYSGFVDCDFLAAAAVVRPESVKEIRKYTVNVEARGKFTRGQAIAVPLTANSTKDNKTIVTVVEAFHDEQLEILRQKISDL